MTSTPSEPRLYDVWLMWVEFPDHPGIGKPRPCVLASWRPLCERCFSAV